MNDTEGIGKRDDNFFKALPTLLVKAGNDAFKNSRHVKQAKQIQTGLEGTVGYNRVSDRGPVDNELRAVAFYFEKEKPLAMISFGCHPVTIGRSTEISVDYPGSVVREMNRAGYDCLFLNAFCGDIDPVSNIVYWGSGTQETIDGYGKTIASTFFEKISEGETMADLSIESFWTDVRLNMVKLGNEDIDKLLQDSAEDKNIDPGKYKLMQLWAERMKENLKSSRDPYGKTLSVQTFRIGDVIMAGFPAEMFTALGQPLREALSDMNVMALGNANATTGYIATCDDIENGGYAGLESSFLYMTLPLETGEGERFGEEVAKDLKTKLSMYKK